MTNFCYEVGIIGGGIIGCSALKYLSEKGIGKCVLLESSNQAGLGATGAWGSLIRAFHHDPLTTERACKSLPFYFNNYPQIEAQRCFNKTGSIYFIKKNQLAEYNAQLATLEKENIEFEIVSPQKGKSCFPQFNWFEDDVGIYEPNAGNACPYAVTKGLLNLAQKNSADVFFNKHVKTIQSKKDFFTLECKDDSQFYCRYLVICAGIWTRDLAETFDFELPVFTKTIQLNRLCKTHQKISLPLFIDRSQSCFGHFFPDGSFVGGVVPSTQISQNQKDFSHLSLQQANKDKFSLSHRLKWVKNAKLEGGVKAFESYCRKGNQFIDFVDKDKRVLAASGFGCTGFTLAPLIGQTISSLIGERVSQ